MAVGALWTVLRYGGEQQGKKNTAGCCAVDAGANAGEEGAQNQMGAGE